MSWSEPIPSAEQGAVPSNGTSMLIVEERYTHCLICVFFLITFLISGQLYAKIKSTTQLKKDEQISKFIQKLREGPLSRTDEVFIQQLLNYSNRPSKIFMVCLPSLIAIILGPIPLIVYPYIAKALWPGIEPPDITDALINFVTVSGLLYAYAFDSTLNAVLNKHAELQGSLFSQLSLIHRLLEQISILDINTEEKLRWLNYIKDSSLKSNLKLLGATVEPDANEDGISHAQNLMFGDTLKLNEGAHVFEYLLLEKVADDLSSLELTKMRVQHLATSKLDISQWIMVLLFGLFSLAELAFLTTKSSILAAYTGMAQVGSISFLCLLIADIDDVYNGVFQVHFNHLLSIIVKHVEVSKKCRDADNVDMGIYDEDGDDDVDDDDYNTGG